MQDQLRQLGDPAAKAIRFRREVQLDGAALTAESRFKVELMSLGSNVHVWVNVADDASVKLNAQG